MDSDDCLFRNIINRDVNEEVRFLNLTVAYKILIKIPQLSLINVVLICLYRRNIFKRK